ncbi:MAG: NAD(P)-binding domain-containing protein [Myxococcota bacterium]
MNIGVLGTGAVGRTIASRLTALGHAVRLGARSADNQAARDWVATTGGRGSAGTFADAAGFGEVVFLCTNGGGAVEAVRATGRSLDGKLVLDVTNPLDFSRGMPPTLFTDQTESLGERVQAAIPAAKVVKTLNTLNCELMVDPGRLGQGAPHAVFVSGDDAGARGRAAELLAAWFGWQQVIELGPLSTARGTEAYVMLWVRLWGALGTAEFNVAVVR